MLTIFQLFAARTEASILRMLGFATRVSAPILEYLEAQNSYSPSVREYYMVRELKRELLGW